MGKIRIISGAWRGRMITVPNRPLISKMRSSKPQKNAPKPNLSPSLSLPLNTLRPTTDRARTTLFNWLQHLNVINPSTQALDLFCGTGILGLEALSRGVETMTFVDIDPALMRGLSQQFEKLKTSLETPASMKTAFICNDVLRFAQQQNEDKRQWTLILCDPPYSDTDYALLMQKLRPLIAEGGLLYLEANRSLVVEASQWGYEVIRYKTIAKTSLHLLAPKITEAVAT